MIKDEIIYEFCKDHYYCDPDDDGERSLWEPFEHWDEDRVEELIEGDVRSLQWFLKKHIYKEWDEQSN